MRLTRSLPLLPLLAAALLPGCRQPPPEPRPPLPPVKPMAEVVAELNAKNDLIPHLWSRHYYEATIIDEKGGSHFVNGDGALLFRRPQSMLLAGVKPGIGRVFEIGSTDEEYWMKVVPEMDTMWWGKYEHLGKPCVQKIPIAPNLVFEVLGIGTFTTDLTDMPAPVMRYNNDAEAYMFVWITKLVDRYAAVKEVWYDHRTLLPKLVLLFDEHGKVVLRAYLANHQPVEVPDVPREQWPKVATSYKLYFPENGTKMSFDLSGMVLDNKGVPSRRGIVFPGVDEAGVAKVIQLDEECDRTGQ